MPQQLKAEGFQHRGRQCVAEICAGAIAGPAAIEMHAPEVETEIDADLGADNEADRRQQPPLAVCQLPQQQRKRSQAVERLHRVRGFDRQHPGAQAAIGWVADHVAVEELGLQEAAEPAAALA